MNKPVECFAVTDQQSIIPLKEISRTVYEEDELCEIETEICGEVEYPEHCAAHHDIYFRKMWLNPDGEPDNGRVFMARTDAERWAIKAINTKVAGAERELRTLQSKLAKLTQ